MKIKPLLAGVAALLILFLFTHCSGDPKFRQYYNKGQQLYAQHCTNCHQDDGTGFKSLYPPLARSDYMIANPEQVLCIMKYGTGGEMTVNGVTFNQPMPGVPSLTDLEIAEIATYIYNTWGNETGLVSVQDAARIMAACEQK
jgi:mono/diheme cytochrome c family protein